MKTRLHQYLSNTGHFKSKKELLNAITNNEIRIGRNTITNPHHQFDPKKERVFHKDLFLKPIRQKTYIIMNKPIGYLSTKLTENDKKMNKKTTLDLIKGLDKNTHSSLFTIGRLDENTSGLLIITNDGPLSREITDPERKINKTYKATLAKEITKEEASKLEKGVTIRIDDKNYQTRPVKIELINKKELTITINEGKKREIRKIFETIKNKVIKLERTAIGQITLQNTGLKTGEYKKVNKEFIIKRLI